MGNEIRIQEIINFLRSKNYSFEFKGDKNSTIKGFSTLFKYQENTMTFISSLNKFSDYLGMFNNQKIQLIITDSQEDMYDQFINVIQIEQPKSVFFFLLDEFFNIDSAENNTLITSQPCVYKQNSFISENAIIGEGVKIGCGCIIEGNVYIGDNTEIHHNVVIRAKSVIGDNCTIYSGTVIGESGFNPLKGKGQKRTMIKHYGGVTIEDNVHIGDNCNISRGTIENTIINKGVKINKQVVIAHNVEIGKHTVITAPTFVSGSVSIGDNCHIAANVIRNQCNIGDNAILGLGSVVVKDVEAGDTVIGNPARSMNKR